MKMISRKRISNEPNRVIITDVMTTRRASGGRRRRRPREDGARAAERAPRAKERRRRPRAAGGRRARDPPGPRRIRGGVRRDWTMPPKKPGGKGGKDAGAAATPAAAKPHPPHDPSIANREIHVLDVQLHEMRACLAKASSATEALTATREALRDAIAREEETERDVAEYVTAEIAAREHALTRLEALAAEYERQIEEEKARHAEEMAAEEGASEYRGGVQRRQLALKGVEGGD